jgi:hypothetical protein
MGLWTGFGDKKIIQLIILKYKNRNKLSDGFPVTKGLR